MGAEKDERKYDDWVMAAAVAPRPNGIIVIPAMIVAGLNALGFFARDVELPEDCVEKVYLAMALAKDQAGSNT